MVGAARWISPVAVTTGDEKVTLRLQGTCPFCQKAFAAVAPPDDSPNGPSVLHELPMCHEFETKDILEYLKAVRVRISG